MTNEVTNQHGTVSSLRPRSSAPVAPSAPGTTPVAARTSWASQHPDEVTEGCEATTAWSGAERRLLASLPEPGEVLDDEVWCGLEGDHQGAHWTLAQVSGDDFWWLRWDETGRRELVHHAVCRRRCGPDESGEPDVPCDLPGGHVGAHSYTRPA